MSTRLNNWGVVIGIIGVVAGIFFGCLAWHYSSRQDDDMRNNRLRKEYENIILMIEQGKTCKNQLIEKMIRRDSVSKGEKYDCFKIDSVSGGLLSKFIMEHETVETLSAIDYYIAYFDNKKIVDESYKKAYSMEIEKLKDRRKVVLEIIASESKLKD